MSLPRDFWEEVAAAILVFLQTVSCVFFFLYFFFMALRSKIKYIFFMTMPGSTFC